MVESLQPGRALRLWRQRRGLSLRKLAQLVNYTSGYLSRVENGDRPLTPELARRCDQVLGAGNQLIALVEVGPRRLAQLPPASATFVGREALLRQLDDAVANTDRPGTPRAVAVDGPPGAGKTALALRLAHEIKERFPDGQLYVDLHGYSPDGHPARPHTVLEEFLIALGVHTDVLPSGLQQRAALYRSMLDGRRVLVMLDNALDSQQVEPLLPASDRCAVVVTSRRRLSGLDLAPHQRVTLDPMSEDESVTLLRAVIGAGRADGDPAAVRELAVRCGHLPLALRIAGERVATHPHRPVRELLDELGSDEHRLDQLASGDSVAVRNVFSWSYRDLDPEDARMFRRTGLHCGTRMSVQAAAALAGVPTVDAWRLMDRLVGVHLVNGAADGRYQVHDLLRVYAAERATAEESEHDRADAVRRMLDWYLHTAYAANHMLAPQRQDPALSSAGQDIPVVEFTDYDQALAWCEVELSNLVAATRMALSVGEYVTAWKLPVGCFNYLHLRKRWSQWVAAHEVGVQGARRVGDQFGEAWVLNNLAIAYRELRRFDDARAAFGRALALRREVGDRVGEGWTLTATAFVDADQKRYADAAGHLTEALAIFRNVGERHGEGITLANLGDTYRELRRFAESLDSLRRALDISHDIDDRHGQGYTLVKLGRTYRELRRTDDALESFELALAARREIGDRWGEGETLQDRGLVLRDSGRLTEARASWRQAMAIFEELGDRRAEEIRAYLRAVEDGA